MKNKTHTGFRIRQEGSRQIIQLQSSWIRIFSRVFGCLFTTVWLSGWSVGCALLGHTLLTEFSWLVLLFSIPFFIGWFAGAALLLATLFGKTRLMLDKDYLEYKYSVLLPVKQQRILRDEILAIELSTFDRRSGITIETTGEPLRVGLGYSLQVLEEVHSYLLDQIPIVSGGGGSKQADDPVRLQQRTDKPESSCWHLEDGFSQNETKFVNHGSFEIGATLLLAGITLFWNGIVGAFIVKVVQAWRGMGDQPASIFEAIFLIPFVLIGSVMLLLLLITVLEPFRKTVHGFSAREISRQFGYFGIAWTKVWPVMAGVTMGIELETDFEDDPEMKDGRGYCLTFSQTNEEKNEKLTEIGGLTLAEASWIATEIENRQSSYTRVASSDGGDGLTPAFDQQKQ